jgi:hypothetical protein
MRYFPIGRRLDKAVSLKKTQFHSGSTVVSRMPPAMITGASKWHYAAFLPVKVKGNPHLCIEVSLNVKRGRVGVGIQRADEFIVEQFPLPDRRNGSSIRFFVENPQDCHHILFRNWGDSGEPSEFSIEEVSVHEAFREITAEQFQDMGPENWVHLNRPWLSYLELHIIDYCNLSCPFCSHGTSGTSRGNSLMTLADCKAFSKHIGSFEFDGLKIAGGEPSLHPEFAQLCGAFKELFPVLKYDLASNGKNLLHHLEDIKVFDWIDLSLYTGRNDEIYTQLRNLNLPNVFCFEKADGIELFDSATEAHLDELFVFENCPCSNTKMIANGRMYDCPGVYGQMIPPKKLSMEQSSVPYTGNWRTDLAKVDIESLCKLCFWPVDAPKVVGDVSKCREWKLPKRIGQSIYSRSGEILHTDKVSPEDQKNIIEESSIWCPPLEQPYETARIYAKGD